mgnify:CR=1 FL=1
MLGLLDIDPAAAAPIWRQISDGMRRLVASGALPAGTAVPSVRELARELRVNPATVAKAYQRLSDAGVLMVKRGEGTFVAERPPDQVAGDRQQILADSAGRFVAVARTVQSSRDEALGAVQEAWDDGGGE